MKTRADLIEQALQEMNLLEAGQSVGAEDSAAVRATIGPKLAELAALDVIYIPDDDRIDDTVFLPLARILAHANAAGFGIGGAKAAELERNADKAESRLRTINRARSARQMLRVERICGARRRGYAGF